MPPSLSTLRSTQRMLLIHGLSCIVVLKRPDCTLREKISYSLHFERRCNIKAICWYFCFSSVVALLTNRISSFADSCIISRGDPSSICTIKDMGSPNPLDMAKIREYEGFSLPCSIFDIVFAGTLDKRESSASVKSDCSRNRFMRSPIRISSSDSLKVF